MANFPLSMTLTDEGFMWFLTYCKKKKTNYKAKCREILQEWVEVEMRKENEKKE